MKFGFPMAQTATTLIYGLIEYEAAYANAGELDNMRECVKWVLDYFIKCHPTPDEFYFQVSFLIVRNTFTYDRPNNSVTMIRNVRRNRKL